MTPPDPPGRETADRVPTASPPGAVQDAGRTSGAPSAQGSGGRRRPFLRRRPLVVLVSAVVGVAVLATAADLVLEHTARQRIARAAACELKPTGPVSASLSGSAAGLRLLTGEVGTVHIRAEDVRRDGMSLSVAADLRRVTTKGTISGGTATASLPYDELAGRLGNGVAGLRPESDGHGALVLTGTLAGIPLPVTVHTRITTGSGGITVAPTDVSVLGQDISLTGLTADQNTSSLAAKLAPRTVPVPDLPAGVTLSRVRADDGGLTLTLDLASSVSSGGSKGCAA